MHEVHAATGPGFNVYACRGCAEQYPPRGDPYELLDGEPRPSRLTLRVYRINKDGTVSEEQEKVEVLVHGGAPPVSLTSAFPPCGCLRCRRGAQ